MKQGEFLIKQAYYQESGVISQELGVREPASDSQLLTYDSRLPCRRLTAELRT